MTDQQANPDPMAGGMDRRAWQAKLDAARSSQGSDLKASAEKWAGTLAVLIGAVGSISVLVVPKALAGFSDDSLRDAVFWLALTAGLSGLFALGAATYVSQGWPKVDPLMDADKFARQSTDKAASAVTWLSVSRWATLAALVCVIAASVVSQTDTFTAPAAPVDVLVVHSNGSVNCGPVAAAAAPVTSVTVVAHC
jgi:hypothetical protein